MLHTKTTSGYDDHDYWVVSYLDCRTNPPKKVIKEYSDVDNAYEDYYYYKDKYWVADCTYDHYRR